jgi:hypothetical protein
MITTPAVGQFGADGFSNQLKEVSRISALVHLSYPHCNIDSYFALEIGGNVVEMLDRRSACIEQRTASYSPMAVSSSRVTVSPSMGAIFLVLTCLF